MRAICGGLLIGLTATGSAQTWSKCYESGLEFGKAGQWGKARAAFRQSIALRPEDSSEPTTLSTKSGRSVWRNGAPYSPNLLAAYALFRETEADPKEVRVVRLKLAADELEALVQRLQFGRSALYLLVKIYDQLGNADGATQTRGRVVRLKQPEWRAETSLFTPEELLAIRSPFSEETRPVASGRVEARVDKYALLIANPTTPGASPAESVRALAGALTEHAGYPADHIRIAEGVSASQLREAANDMARSLPRGATVFFYFAGTGVRRDGADYLAGAGDASDLVAKSEIYRVLSASDASIFAFFESNRPVSAGAYFGSELPTSGRIAQMQATLPGEPLTTRTVDGRVFGTFASALVDVLRDQHANQIAITEFSWQVYYRMRQGNGAKQTSTLPQLIGLTGEAKF